MISGVPQRQEPDSSLPLADFTPKHLCISYLWYDLEGRSIAEPVFLSKKNVCKSAFLID